MTTITPLREVLAGILDGSYDEELSAISDAVRSRMKDVRDQKAKLNGLTLKPGDRVTMHGLTPKLLNGQIVEVVEINRTRATVKAIEGVTNAAATARVGTHGMCRVPLTCVTAIDA